MNLQKEGYAIIIKIFLIQKDNHRTATLYMYLFIQIMVEKRNGDFFAKCLITPVLKNYVVYFPQKRAPLK